MDSFCDQALECSVNSKRYILPSKIILPPCAQGLMCLAVEAHAVYGISAILAAKLHISVDFAAGFDRNM